MVITGSGGTRHRHMSSLRTVYGEGGFILRRLRLAVMIFICFLICSAVSRGGTGEQWKVKINIPATTMFVYKDGLLWRKFNVAVGRIEKQTPIGQFYIVSKIKDPTWYPQGKDPVPPGPENPLGSYWLGLNIPGYGIHGNNNPFSIGYWVSSGCIRVKNEDIALLFTVLPVGTPVEIVYEPINLLLKEDRIWLDLYPDIYRLVLDQRQLVRDTVRKEYPSFNLHEDGLWHVIGEHRPVLLELPEAMDLYIDEELFPEKAFRWKDQIFLPPSVHELWGMRRAGTPGQKYPLLWDFLAEHSGKAFGLWDEQTNSVRITTLRLYYQGKPLPVRGWLREEPYLPWPELFSVFQEIGLVEHGGPGENLSVASSTAVVQLDATQWIGLSKLREFCPQLRFQWEAGDWVIRMD